MFKDDERKQVGRSDNVVAATLMLERLTPAELISLYEEVRGRLPPTKLIEINMEEELLLQYHTVRALQGQILADEGTPANQKAQVANSVGTSLNQITSLQERVYHSERFKRLELLLIRGLRKLPEEVAAEFLTEFERDYQLAEE